MSVKYTPGPWVAAETQRGVPVVQDTDGKNICQFDWRYTPRRTANVHLIKAAPDMLEALQGLLDRPGPIYHLVDDERHWPQIAAARAAIAKATGEPK